MKITKFKTGGWVVIHQISKFCCYTVYQKFAYVVRWNLL